MDFCLFDHGGMIGGPSLHYACCPIRIALGGFRKVPFGNKTTACYAL